MLNWIIFTKGETIVAGGGASYFFIYFYFFIFSVCSLFEFRSGSSVQKH